MSTSISAAAYRGNALTPSLSRRYARYMGNAVASSKAPVTGKLSYR